ncbi:hypothetical protein TRVL_06492 [Trypanosoma vivax]|nr:hypothetical protein TRVL_06492 [Trypanosoma vivax]
MALGTETSPRSDVWTANSQTRLERAPGVRDDRRLFKEMFVRSWLRGLIALLLLALRACEASSDRAGLALVDAKSMCTSATVLDSLVLMASDAGRTAETRAVNAAKCANVFSFANSIAYTETVALETAKPERNCEEGGASCKGNRNSDGSGHGDRG